MNIQTTTPLRRLLACLLATAVMSGAALAQEPAAQDIIQGMQDTLDGTAGATFLVTGELLGGDGTVYQLEIEVEAMPAEQLIRLFILQPDALADNIIIVTQEALYNYNYLTNQIVVYDADDPQAYGPLGGGGDGGSFELTLDLAQLFSGWDSRVAGNADTPAGQALRLELSNRDPEANIAAASVLATQDNWFPQEITLFTRSGATMLRIELQDVDLEPGLSADDLLWYPPDAELIDDRSN